MFAALRKLRDFNRLVRGKRFREVLAEARDPLIRDQRSVLEARARAREAIRDEALQAAREGRRRELLDLVWVLRTDGEGPDLADLAERVEACSVSIRRLMEEHEGRLGSARGLLDRGDPRGALAEIQDSPRSDGRVAALLGEAEDRIRRARAHVRAGDGCLSDGRIAEACGELGAACKLDASAGGACDLAGKLLACARSLPVEDLTAVLRAVSAVARETPGLLLDRERQARRHLDLIEERLRSGSAGGAFDHLEIYPLGLSCDARAERLVRGLGSLARFRRRLEAGDLRRARANLASAAGRLPGSRELEEFDRRLARLEDAEARAVEAALHHLRNGSPERARGCLEGLPGAEGPTLEVRKLLDLIGEHEREDEAAIAAAREALASGAPSCLRAALSSLSALLLRRTDLPAASVLQEEVKRKLGFQEPDGSPDRVSRSSPSFDGAPGFPQRSVLRVEERGDWLVLPQDAVDVGRAGGGARIQLLAAIGKRQAVIERRMAGDAIAYFLRPGGGVCSRNRRDLSSTAELKHGDVLGFGGIVEARFLLPVPGNGTAVVEFEEPWEVEGCRRVILLGGCGREHAIVCAPGPAAHVPLGQGAEHLELIAVEGVQGSAHWLARSRTGVAAGGGPERPQVRIEPGEPVRAGSLRVVIDGAGGSR